jgi:hypothetical protein
MIPHENTFFSNASRTQFISPGLPYGHFIGMVDEILSLKIAPFSCEKLTRLQPASQSGSE